MFKGDKGVEQVRITFVFDFYTGDCKNGDYFFRFYPFPTVVFIKVFGKEFSDTNEGVFF